MSLQLSIITVTRNASQCVEKTIMSVISQTVFSNQIQYILIDGASTDDTMSIVERYKAYIDCIISESDYGIYDAMNKGVQIALAPWILFMNADDTIYDKETIESLHLEAANPDHIIYGDHIIKYGDRERPEKAKPFWNNSQLLSGIGICHQSIYMPTLWMKLHPFAWRKYKFCADFEAVFYWHQQGKYFKYVERPLCRYEQGNGYTSNLNVWGDLLKENAKIVGKRHSFKFYILWLRYFLTLCINKIKI